MRKLYETKQEKLQFIINKLNKLKGLEFIDKDEIDAVNCANSILRNKIKEWNKIEPKEKKSNTLKIVHFAQIVNNVIGVQFVRMNMKRGKLNNIKKNNNL